MNHKIKNLDLYICLFVLVVSSFLASVIQTSFYQVNISLEKLDTSNNQYIYFDLYKPLSASKENPAPFIAIIPGFQRSKEALSNIAIELSRRGYVVGLIDPYAQGAYPHHQIADDLQQQKDMGCLLWLSMFMEVPMILSILIL